jgi:hypothetical protein
MLDSGEATGSFSVTMPLTKVWRDEDGELWFEGVASSTRLDRQQERMTQKAIEAMSQQTNIELVPSHHAGPLDELGFAEECWADNDRFRVAGRLEKGNPMALRLFEKVQAGKRYGLSVGGRVRKAFWRYDDEAGRPVRHIDEVELSHVALCRPEEAANPDTYLAVLAKAAEPVTEEMDAAAADAAREPEAAVLVRIGRAAVQAARALWPFGKAMEGEPGAPGTLIEQELSKAVKLREQLEEMLTDASEALAEASEETQETQSETMEHGQPQSLPGQETYAGHGGDYWKGVL